MSSQAKLLLEATFGLQALRMTPIGNPGSDSGDQQEKEREFINSITGIMSPAYVIWKIVEVSNVENPEDITVDGYKELVRKWRTPVNDQLRKTTNLDADKRIEFVNLIGLTYEANTLKGDNSLAYFIPNPITQWESIVESVEDGDPVLIGMAETDLEQLKDV